MKYLPNIPQINLTQKEKKIAVVASTAVVCTVAAPFVFTGLIGLAGFSSGGIVGGSLAAKLMALYGGKVGAGSICAILQSIGTGGLGVVGNSAACAVGAGVGGASGLGIAAAVPKVKNERKDKLRAASDSNELDGSPSTSSKRNELNEPSDSQSNSSSSMPPDDTDGVLENTRRLKGVEYYGDVFNERDIDGENKVANVIYGGDEEVLAEELDKLLEANTNADSGDDSGSEEDTAKITPAKMGTRKRLRFGVTNALGGVSFEYEHDNMVLPNSFENRMVGVN